MLVVVAVVPTVGVVNDVNAVDIAVAVAVVCFYSEGELAIKSLELFELSRDLGCCCCCCC